MAAIVKLPICNVVMGGAYTAPIALGSAGVTLEVLLDTGSSTLVVDGQRFDPASCPGTRTTSLAQTVRYGAGGWVGAVVQAPVALAPGVGLPATTVAVTYGETPAVFGQAGGILGLAYAPLDAAYQTPGDAWTARYAAAQLAAFPVVDLEPYFAQLEEAGVVANRFALATRRSAVSLAGDDPRADPLNHGVLVLGGGAEATELYAGAFTEVAVIDDVWYDAELVGLRVGDGPVLPAAAPPPGGPARGNAMIDSGTNCLLLAQPLYDAAIAAFGAIDPALARALTAHAVGGAGLDHAQLDLARWPPLGVVLQGADGAPVTLEIAPADYWQLDAAGKGLALAYLCGDGGQLGGRSILGLPLFAGRYVVFDRAAAGGRGVIGFAAMR